MSTVQLRVRDLTRQKREVIDVQQEEMTWGEVTLMARDRLGLGVSVTEQEPAVYHLSVNGSSLDPNVTVAETLADTCADIDELEFIMEPSMNVGGIGRA